MREIGGYIELDTHHLPMLYEDGIKLNCGRNALWYLLKARKIHKIWMPKFMCDSCNGVLKKENVEVTYYSIGLDFKPKNVNPAEDEWLYVVNFYGQLSNGYLSALKECYPKLIVDNAQAYFQMPVVGADTIYTCRKFFGVSDGAILYTDAVLDAEIPLDESFERMHFLLGRYERSASEYYNAIGGLQLYSFSDFQARGIHLAFVKTGEITYRQFGDTFEPNLSIIDVMMFNPVDEIREMLCDFELIES